MSAEEWVSLFEIESLEGEPMELTKMAAGIALLERRPAHGALRILQRLLAPPRQHHRRALFCQRDRRCLTDPRASTGHPGDLARQRSH